MSRIGKLPVAIPSGVTVRLESERVWVKGPKGELSMHILTGTTVTVADEQAQVTAEKITGNPAFGTMRALIQNMVLGVTTGFSKTLEIVGTGYRAAMEGKDVVLQLGYSHPIRFSPPEGIAIKVENPTRLTISGADKALVGQVAADIRAFRPPEPYKGKGVKYEGEYIRRKAGKTAGAAS
jgi:large subunit ribosomal protein L6